MARPIKTKEQNDLDAKASQELKYTLSNIQVGERAFIPHMSKKLVQRKVCYHNKKQESKIKFDYCNDNRDGVVGVAILRIG
jgi:hypothetical protein